MGAMFRDIVKCATALLNNWLQLAGGGVMAVLGWTWPAVSSKLGHPEWATSVPPICLWTLAVLGFLWAFFKTWRAEHQSLGNTQSHAMDVEAALADLRQRARANDPHILAFVEQRSRDVLDGEPIDEWGLAHINFWITQRSAWGRWQAAQHKAPTDSATIRGIADSYLLSKMVEGVLQIRGIRSDTQQYEFISPDYWKTVYLHTFFDPSSGSLFRSRIYPRSITSPTDSDDSTDKTYTAICCDMKRVRAHFPATDSKTDRLTRKLLGPGAP